MPTRQSRARAHERFDETPEEGVPGTAPELPGFVSIADNSMIDFQKEFLKAVLDQPVSHSVLRRLVSGLVHECYDKWSFNHSRRLPDGTRRRVIDLTVDKARRRHYLIVFASKSACGTEATPFLYYRGAEAPQSAEASHLTHLIHDLFAEIVASRRKA